MRLAFSSNAYLNYSFAEAARRIAAIGYRGIEVMADVPHAWPAYILPEQKRALRTEVERNGLTISNVNAFMMNAIDDPRQRYWHPSWIEPDPHYRRIRIEHTKRALTLAREIASPCITTEPGGPVEPGGSWTAALNLFVEMIKPVAEHAEREGVLLLVEPEPGLLIESTEQFEEFIGRINSPAVGLNFDVGHMFCVGEDPAESLRRLARFVKHIHVEDIAASRVHAHLVPGEGAIDFGEFLGSVRQIGYAGWLTVELYPYIENPDRAAREALERLTAIVAKSENNEGV
jgi:sugar phosphate isomerase/epimerase